MDHEQTATSTGSPFFGRNLVVYPWRSWPSRQQRLERRRCSVDPKVVLVDSNFQQVGVDSEGWKGGNGEVWNVPINDGSEDMFLFGFLWPVIIFYKQNYYSNHKRVMGTFFRWRNVIKMQLPRESFGKMKNQNIGGHKVMGKSQGGWFFPKATSGGKRDNGGFCTPQHKGPYHPCMVYLPIQFP